MPTAWLLFITLLVPQPIAQRSNEAEYETWRADVQVMNRQFDAAIALYRRALALSPDYAPARKGLGRVFDLQGRHADAQTEYESALRKAGEFDVSALLRHLTISLAFQRRYDEAHRTLTRWLDMTLARNGGELPMGYLDFYDLALARGDFDEAERVLDKFYAAALKPPAMADAKDPEVMFSGLQRARYEAMRAAVAARRGRTAEASKLLQQAEARFAATFKKLLSNAPAGAPVTALGDDDTETMLPVGEVAFWLGDTARAIRAMEPMMIKLPRHNLMLGQSYEKQGNLPAARDAYRRIVDSPLLSLDLAWARPIAEARLKELNP